jgi:hypothetical protein
MATRTKEKTLDISDLLLKQLELTAFFRKNNDIQVIDWDKSKGAIICELWEMANELKNEGFKEWTVLFFYLQTGNDLGVVEEHHWIETHPNIMKQILAINTSLLSIDGILMWTLSFAQYRGLVQMLGFDWEKDIIPEYDLKYQENIARQKRGY